ncbi:uncharacterized protein LOC123831971 [Phyllostomus hastatus]|uniref:uncharacterized protein LOC123831971 n=1 Tax=Phyllostomus hastatus TaxID=9423 RepID=UPI001E680841|nr:uncharacterized protein LOC123831971 [Phyllostomus hastatus]
MEGKKQHKVGTCTVAAGKHLSLSRACSPPVPTPQKEGFRAASRTRGGQPHSKGKGGIEGGDGKPARLILEVHCGNLVPGSTAILRPLVHPSPARTQSFPCNAERLPLTHRDCGSHQRPGGAEGRSLDQAPCCRATVLPRDALQVCTACSLQPPRSNLRQTAVSCHGRSTEHDPAPPWGSHHAALPPATSLLPELSRSPDPGETGPRRQRDGRGRENAAPLVHPLTPSPLQQTFIKPSLVRGMCRRQSGGRSGHSHGLQRVQHGGDASTCNRHSPAESQAGTCWPGTAEDMVWTAGSGILAQTAHCFTSPGLQISAWPTFFLPGNRKRAGRH